MKELYKLMNNKKLSSPEGIFTFCGERNFEEVVETALEGFSDTIQPLHKIEPSLFNFSASLTLSGGNYPCESLPCRFKKIVNLAKFTSIYSNHTTIYNPFDFVYLYLDSKTERKISENKFRAETANAFIISLELKPLIERGLIEFSRTVYTVCKKCETKRKEILSSIEKELENISQKRIFPLIQHEISIEYEKNSIHLSGIEPLIGEDLYIHYKIFPKFLIDNGKKIDNLKNIEYKNPLIQMLIDEAINSLMFQKFDCIEGYTQTYLTTNLFEKKLLEEIASPIQNKVQNISINNLPIIQDIPYEYVIDIRDSHPDEFKSFQAHVLEITNKAKSFETQDEFNIYVGNQLKNEIQILTNIQEEGRKKLHKKGFINGLLLGASIVVSSTTNYDIPSILGIAKTFYNCTEMLSEAKELEYKIQKNPIYFYYLLSK